MDAKYSGIKRACRIDSLIFFEVLIGLREGKFKTEKSISLFILKRFRKLGLMKAFPPIVANNCAEIHAKPRNKKLAHGFLVLDFGVRYRGMASDFTRTIFLGKASAEERKLYNLILKCQKECVKRAKIGADCKGLDALARKKLGKYARYFTHALGHGVGRRIHMRPRISPKSKEKLLEGQCITIEPGIYLKRSRGRKEFGIRIEDTLFIGKKTEVLTRAPRRLIEVEANFK